MGDPRKWNGVARQHDALFEVNVHAAAAWLLILSQCNPFYHGLLIDHSVPDDPEEVQVNFTQLPPSKISPAESTTSDEIRTTPESSSYTYSAMVDECVAPNLDLLGSLLKGSLGNPLKIVADKQQPANTLSNLEAVLCKSFPNLFIMGECGGPKRGTLCPALVMHFFKYYDGRFVRSPLFLATLFSIDMRQKVVARGAQMKGSDPKILQEIGEFMSSGTLEEELQLASQVSLYETPAHQMSFSYVMYLELPCQNAV